MRLLLLHGALGSHHQLMPLRDCLRDELPRNNVDILEFVGHGSTADVEAGWTIELYSQQLERYLREHEPHAIFGYSMGGYVALHLALNGGHALCPRIITLGTKLVWTPQGAATEVARMQPDVVATKVPAFAADLQRRHGDAHWRTMLTKTSAMMQTLAAQPLLTPSSMSTMQSSVRYMVGDCDSMVSIDETVEFYRATPRAELAVLPATKHPIERVDVDTLVHHIRQFIYDNPA
ncbi:MAG: alpha/beta fold hydrolase [bacterium]|nr:alpha/beta fold hydrolase [bacterium]